jgi:hypothetical protein
MVPSARTYVRARVGKPADLWERPGPARRQQSRGWEHPDYAGSAAAAIIAGDELHLPPARGGIEMKWLFLLIPAAVAAAAVVVRYKAKSGGLDIEQMIKKMPAGAPPRWAYENVTAVRKNTERIIELLEAEKT